MLNINQPFSNALRNRTSPQYKKLSTDVTNAVSRNIRFGMQIDNPVIVKIYLCDKWKFLHTRLWCMIKGKQF